MSVIMRKGISKAQKKLGKVPPFPYTCVLDVCKMDTDTAS